MMEKINRNSIQQIRDGLEKRLSVLNIAIHAACDLIGQYEDNSCYNSNGLNHAYSDLREILVKQDELNIKMLHYLDECENKPSKIQNKNSKRALSESSSQIR